MKNYIITTRDNQKIEVKATVHLNGEVAEHGLVAVILHAVPALSAGNVATIEIDGEVYDMRGGGRGKLIDKATGKKLAYKGKYPNRIRSVYTIKSKKGVLGVTLNSGEKYTVAAKDVGGVEPELGQEISAIPAAVKVGG